MVIASQLFESPTFHVTVSEDLKTTSLRNQYSMLFFLSFRVFPKEFMFSKARSMDWMVFHSKTGNEKSYNFLLASVR